MNDGSYDFFNDRKRQRPQHVDLIITILESPGIYRLTHWEVEFLNSMRGFRVVSPRQAAVLSRLAEKVSAPDRRKKTKAPPPRVPRDDFAPCAAKRARRSGRARR